MSVSVLILTYNEAANIDACLASVAWSDDVLVVDSFSSDGTVERARAAGARVLQRPFDHFAGQRNWGLEEGGFRHDWVLHLDADERVTGPGRRELEAIAARPLSDAEPAGYRVASKTLFRDQWLRRSGMYPTYQVRFGRLDRLAFEQVGHGQRETLDPDQVGTLDEPLLHYSFSKGLADWFERHNRYSTDEARHAFEAAGQDLDVAGLFQGADPVRRRRALKALSYRLPFRPGLRFLYMYVLRGGVLDGRAGLEYCRMMAAYEYMIGAKLRSLQAAPTGGSPPPARIAAPPPAPDAAASATERTPSAA